MSIVATPRRPAVALKRFFFPALPHIQTGTHFNIPSLDGIRAVSILMVVVSHCGLGKWVPGGFGVTIFFFLSGYLITTLMRREHAKTGTLSLNDFYIRRCLRILPPSFIVIAISLLLALIFHETLSWVESSPMSHTSPITMSVLAVDRTSPGSISCGVSRSKSISTWSSRCFTC